MTAGVLTRLGWTLALVAAEYGADRVAESATLEPRVYLRLTDNCAE
jgi:hypothetical protein